MRDWAGAPLTSAVQGSVRDLRMVPVETVFNRFPRMIRSLSHELAGADVTERRRRATIRTAATCLQSVRIGHEQCPDHFGPGVDGPGAADPGSARTTVS